MMISIKAARIDKGFTQREIANKLNICRDTYRKIELHPEKATIKQAKEISNLLGVAYDDLIFLQQSST